MAYQNYPLTMNHPKYEPARMVSAARSTMPLEGMPPGDGRDPRAGARLLAYVPEVWEPEKYPSVFAENESQQKKYEAHGYRVTGVPNAAAYAPSQGPREPPVQYPKWLTPPSGEPVLAKSAAEEAALRAQWSPGP